MKRINSIFHSLQGEGINAGRPAAFVRFAGCNLRCPFCDTSHESHRSMTDNDILETISQWPTRLVVLTGGEPTLQADDAFIALLHQRGYSVAIETNGTRPLPKGIDWATVSPKEAFVGQEGKPVVARCDELKCIFDGTTPITDSGIEASHYCLQPCDTGDTRRNAAIVAACIAYVKAHPRWRLSLQTHKLLGIE